MTILICTEHFFPSVGGVEIHSDILAQALSELEYDVIVYTFEKSSLKQSDKKYTVINHTSIYKQFKIFNSVDLIISNGELSLKCVLPAYFLRKKIICIYHMALPFIRLQDGGNFQFIQNKLRNKLANYVVKHVAVTKAVIKALDLPSHLPTGVLYNPIRKKFVEEIEKYLLEAPDTGLYNYDIIFVGRIIKGKGILDLALALNILDQRKRLIKILLVGEGNDKNEFLELTKSLRNITVEIRDFLNAGALAKAYLDSKILLLPSASHKEGFGLVLVEFFFTGRPVLITDQAAMREVAADAACVVAQSNPEDLANGIEKLLYNEEYFNELKENVKARKDFFTYEYFKHNLDVLIKSVK